MKKKSKRARGRYVQLIDLTQSNTITESIHISLAAAAYHTPPDWTRTPLHHNNTKHPKTNKHRQAARAAVCSSTSPDLRVVDVSVSR